MKLTLLTFVIAVLFIGALAVGFTAQSNGQEARISNLEHRIMELECRHRLFEDGSTLHKDAEAVQECVYVEEGRS